MEIKNGESGNDQMTKSGNLTLAVAEWRGAGEGRRLGRSLAFILMNTGVLISLQNEEPSEYFRRAWESILPSECHELRLMKSSRPLLSPPLPPGRPV